MRATLTGSPHRRAAAPLVVLLLVMGATAQAEGLSWRQDRSPWPQWQARVEWTPPAWDQRRMLPLSAWPTPGLRLLGDRALTGGGDPSGNGLRATAGLLLRPAGSLRLPVGPTASVRETGGTQAADTGAGWQAQGYVGLGYSHQLDGSAWRFNADVGVLGSGLRLDSLPLGGMDARVRELRLSPLLQLGASYAF